MGEGSASNSLPVVVPFVPEVLIEEILVKLPVKSLLRLRCVSKSWWCLISSKSFIQSHLQYSKKNLARRSSLIISDFWKSRSKTIMFDSFLHDQQPEHQDLFGDELVDHPESKYYLTDCCNGLCLVRTREHLHSQEFFLWNPFTRRHRKLPDVGGAREELEVRRYGLGFDESNDDYKVVVVTSIRDSELGGYTVKVYSLKTDSWKLVANKFDYEPTERPIGQRVKGKLHWLSCLSNKIFWFDLATEVEGTLEPPQHRDVPICLGALGECLCLYSPYNGAHNFRVLRADSWVQAYGFRDYTPQKGPGFAIWYFY